MARGGSALRGLAELVTCIAIAVTLLKGFLVEGFLISTGSMAMRMIFRLSSAPQVGICGFIRVPTPSTTSALVHSRCPPGGDCTR